MPTAARLLEAKRIVKAAGVATVLTASVVLTGWFADVAAAKSVFPGWAKMSPATALLFLVLGLGLLIAAGAPASGSPNSLPLFRRLLSIACGAATVTVASLRLVGYSTGRSFHLDLFWFHDLSASPAHMSPATSLAFVLLGASLLLGLVKRLVSLALQILALLGGLLAWVGLSRYLYGGEPLSPFSAMAVHTALLFLVLSVGLINLRPEAGLAALLVSDSAGSSLARRLLPAALLVPLLLGWLRVATLHAGWFKPEASNSLFGVANVLILGALIWANAALVHRSDSNRTLAENKARAQLKRLNLLHEITRAIGGHLDLGSIYQVALRDVEESLRLDFACICNHHSDLHELSVVRVGPRSDPPALQLGLTVDARFPVDPNGLSRCVAGELVYEPDTSRVPMPFSRKLAGAGLHSLVIAPLRTDDAAFAVLVVARREPQSFSSGECEFLNQLCQHVALAAHQAELRSALQEACDSLQQTREAAVQQERLRALGQMASGVAHDINNAISPVLLGTELLLESEPDLSIRARKHLETMHRAATDVGQTIARLREFYRKRDSPMELSPVDINKIVLQVVDLTRARWSDMPQQRGVVIDTKTELASRLPPVSGVESELREALINLVFNAVDAMPDGGSLTLRARVLAPISDKASDINSRNVAVEVIDSGVGMDEQTRAKCFEPFFTTKGERGTGLGLAMVYGVVRRHGGGLEIDTAPGGGTTMRLCLSAGSLIVRPVERQAAPLNGLRVLVIDDDPLVLEALREALEIDGHSVVAANGGKAGIDEFARAMEQKQPFAAVFTDLGMPRVDGRKVAAAIKQASPKTPVILLSGWGQRLVGNEETPPSVDRVLSKPPQLKHLREALLQCVT